MPLSTASSLIVGLKARDGSAWSRMVKLYLPLVHHWCIRGGLPRSDVPDVIQEVFRAVATGMEGFRFERPEGTFRGWLKGITRHKVQDYWRNCPAEGRAVGGSNAQQQLQGIGQALSDDSDAADASPRAELVRRALEMIEVEFETPTWQAFWRTAVDSQDPQDVAASLNVTVNAVYKAKSRVMRRLREILGDLSE